LGSVLVVMIRPEMASTKARPIALIAMCLMVRSEKMYSMARMAGRKTMHKTVK
jgi:hypothetical protein